jgi:hypothetical protein
VQIGDAEEPSSNFGVPNCTAQPISFGQTVNNTITGTDCVGTRGLPGTSFRADEYTFNGQAGQRIVITMNSDEVNNPGTNAIDSYLILRRSNGQIIREDDNGGTNGSQGDIRNARIPALTGFFILPADGAYSIEATTSAGGTSSYGPYTLSLIDGGVVPCETTFINYSLPPVPRAGQLTTNDCVARGQFYTDKYAFEGVAGQSITIDMTSTQVDAYLLLRRQDQTILAENNDGGGGTNARITFTLPTTGLYFIDASTALENQVGGYNLTLNLNLPVGTIPVSVPTVNGTLGSQITVPVTVGALPTGTGANAVRSFQFTINYNPAVLRPVNNAPALGINQTGTLSAPFTCNTNPQSNIPVPNPGAIAVGCFSPDGTPISGSGTLINLVFDVIGNGGTNSPIILSPFMFNEGNPSSFVFSGVGGVIVNQFRMTGNVTYYFGLINGEAKPVAAAQVTATGNPVVQNDSNVRGAYSLDGLSGASYSVRTRKNGDIPERGATIGLPGQPQVPPLNSFDAQMTNAFAVGNITLTANQQRAADVSGNGFVTSFDAALIQQFNSPPTPLLPSNLTGQWRFVSPTGAYNVLSPDNAPEVYTAAQIQSNLTGQNWTGILMGDVSGNWQQPCVPAADPFCNPNNPPTNPPTTFGPESLVPVRLPQMTSQNGTFIEIPVNVGNVTNRGAVSFDFAVLYNPAVLQPVSSPIIQTGTMSQGYTLSANVSQPGRLRVGAYGLTPLSGEGNLLRMRFEVIGAPGANTSLQWENFFFNEGDPATVNTGGTFLVSGRTPFDFDGDGKSDTVVFRSGNSIWYMLNSQSGFSGVNWGLPTDKLAPADYDGDGRTDVAVVRGNVWYILQSQGGFIQKDFGLAGDIPMPGDWDGDGKADVAVYRPAANGVQGHFYFRGSNNNPQGNITFIPWGIEGDIPVLGDFDGDGRMDAAVFRPSNRVWYILQSSDSQLRAVQFGLSTDKLVPADYDGDGRTDIAVFRNGVWYIMKSSNGNVDILNFGLAGDIPIPADYDGDGKADVAIYRGGEWHLLQSTQGYKVLQFGLSDDKPIPATYLP